MIAPFHRVEFRDFFITDELVSIVFTLGMGVLLFCSYALNWSDELARCTPARSWVTPLITMLPPWWRLLQCLRRYYDTKLVSPHIINAIKYSLTVLTVWTGSAWRITNHPGSLAVYLITGITAAIYSSLWDYYKDWGFGDFDCKYKGLRERLLYSWKWVPLFLVL